MAWAELPGFGNRLPISLPDLDSTRVRFFDDPRAPDSDWNTVRQAIRTLTALGVGLWEDCVRSNVARAPETPRARRFNATRCRYGAHRAREILRQEAEAQGRDFEPDWDSSEGEVSSSSSAPAPEEIDARPFGAAAAAPSCCSPTASVRSYIQGGRTVLEC